MLHHHLTSSVVLEGLNPLATIVMFQLCYILVFSVFVYNYYDALTGGLTMAIICRQNTIIFVDNYEFKKIDLFFIYEVHVPLG